MSWARRFLAVPTSALKVSPDIAENSPKGYSKQELQEIVATVPAVYHRIAGGFGEQDFLDLKLSPDPTDRRVGDTYSKLFRDSPSSAPLAAAFDGKDLVVDKGNHRIRAARAAGVPVLPVWVSAPTDAQLSRVENACSNRIEREGAAAYRNAHAAHEAAAGRERQAGQELERSGLAGRDRAHPGGGL